MTLKLSFAIVLFSFYSFVFSAQENKIIKYDLTYENNLQRPFFKIALSFDSDTESTIIQLPSCSGCATNLHSDIEDIQVVGGTLNKTSDPSQYLLIHSPNTHIILTYKMSKIGKGNLLLAHIYVRLYCNRIILDSKAVIFLFIH